MQKLYTNTQNPAKHKHYKDTLRFRYHHPRFVQENVICVDVFGDMCSYLWYQMPQNVQRDVFEYKGILVNV